MRVGAVTAASFIPSNAAAVRRIADLCLRARGPSRCREPWSPPHAGAAAAFLTEEVLLDSVGRPGRKQALAVSQPPDIKGLHLWPRSLSTSQTLKRTGCGTKQRDWAFQQKSWPGLPSSTSSNVGRATSQPSPLPCFARTQSSTTAYRSAVHSPRRDPVIARHVDSHVRRVPRAEGPWGSAISCGATLRDFRWHTSVSRSCVQSRDTVLLARLEPPVHRRQQANRPRCHGGDADAERPSRGRLGGRTRRVDSSSRCGWSDAGRAAGVRREARRAVHSELTPRAPLNTRLPATGLRPAPESRDVG